jgi:major type 1 subunit fimbrin (pilin)
MKRNRLALKIIATILPIIFAPPSHAFDGTITITGQVTAQTCTISGNGGGSSFTVTLPKVSTTSLSTSGATAGTTPFTISLTNCSPNSGAVSTDFEAGPTLDAATGNLTNQATATTTGSGTAAVTTNAATNVEIGLLNYDSSAVTVGSAAPSKSVPITTGSATLKYFARYVATGAVTAGPVSTTVTYSLVYQ